MSSYIYGFYQKALNTSTIFTFPIEQALGKEYRADGFTNWSYDVENVDGALHVRHKNIDLTFPDPSEK